MKSTTHFCVALLLSVFALMIPADKSEARAHAGFGINFTNVVPARQVCEVRREVYREPCEYAVIERRDDCVCRDCAGVVHVYPGYHERYVRIPARRVVRETVVVHHPRPCFTPGFSFGFNFCR